MNRKRALFGFTGIATLLVIASTAFACTAFLGSFTVTGNAGGTVRVDGKDTPTQFTMTQAVNNGIAKASKTGGSFSISTGPSSINGSILPNNKYGIRYYNSSPLLPGYIGTGTSRQWATDCMSAPFGTKIGDTTVTGGVVTGPTSFSFGNTLPLNTNPAGMRESAVCITDSTALYGNQAPITIV